MSRDDVMTQSDDDFKTIFGLTFDEWLEREMAKSIDWLDKWAQDDNGNIVEP